MREKISKLNSPCDGVYRSEHVTDRNNLHSILVYDRLEIIAVLKTRTQNKY